MDNMTGAEKAKEIRNSIFALLIAFIFLFPIYWLIQISFKSDAETFGKVLTYFPHDFTFEPWLENLTDKTFLISLKNSFLNGLLTMAIALVLGVPAAYGMGRYRVKGGNVFLLTFLISQMLPPSLTLTPMYLIFSKLGFLGNHLTAPVAIAASSIPFVIVTLRPYFRSIPVSLDEAARLDGCGSVKAFLMVMLPAVKTGIITITIDVNQDLYDKVLSELVGCEIQDKDELIKKISELTMMKKEYEVIGNALSMAMSTGYGVSSPKAENCKLNKPEIFKTGNRYGIKISSTAPAYHI